MNKFIKKAKATLNVVLAFVLMLPMAITKPIYADEGDPSIKNPDGPTIIKEGDQEIKLFKTVESVPGYANKWKVTLRIESPKTEKTSDTVLVIDRSGSMADDGRLTAAKSAATSLAQQLLPSGNTTNRVAVVSFASTASTGTNFTDNYNTVSSVISGLRATGGTYTQSAIHMAADLLASSTADIKTMILLSDGEPTYSVSFTASARNNDSNFVPYGGQLETSSEVEQSVFNYTATGSVGNGRNLRACIGDTNAWGNCNSGKWYNHGNSAIAEASYFKNANIGDLYTIALDAGTVGTPILNAIASPDKHYTATPSELTTIFNEIGGNILSLIQSASVEDTMGQGVTVSGPDGGSSLEWEPEFELDPEKNIFVAETSYEVEMDESVFEQTPDGGYYALNDSAVLTYNDGKTAEFPVPKAKPFAINVEKEFITIDSDGKETEEHDKEFKFKITGNGQEFTGSVLSGEHNVIPVPMPIKLGTEYTIQELNWVPEDSDTEFENYKVEYFVAGTATDKIIINQDHGDEIDVKIKNTYESVDIPATKTWEDDGNRDGLRKNYNLSAALKADGKYLDYQAITGADTQEFTFEDLPKYYNSAEIDYSVVEAECSGSGSSISCKEFTSDSDYEATITGDQESGFDIVNTHEPATKNLVIKKKWNVAAGTLPSVTPNIITVDLSNDENGDVKTITLMGNGYGEWESEPIEVFVNKSEGVEIVYQVKETKIGTESLIGDNNDTLYVFNDEILEGKWTATNSNLEVTNTWTPATSVYEGESEFVIKKVDQDGKPMDGVKFDVNGTEYTTKDGGKITVTIASSGAESDNLKYEIEEAETLDNYELIDGTEELTVTSTSEFDHYDLDTLENIYTKTYTFAPSEIDGYVWTDSSSEYIVTNQGLGDKITIVKTFKGASEDLLSDLLFTVTGPNGFEEQEISFEDFEVSGTTATYELEGYLPVGDYTVTESNADVENFNRTTTGDNGATKTIELGGEAKFTINNIYDVIKDINFRVKKIWDDVDDQDRVRPTTLSVTLLQNEQEYDTVALEGDDWAYEWTNLPRVDENGEEYVYTAEEEDVDEYESDGGQDINGVFTFTNSYTPKTTKLTIKKVWDTSAGTLPSVTPGFVTVEITNDKNDKVETIVLTGEEYGEWVGEFEGAMYEAGEEITYTVKETKIADDNLSSDDNTLYIYDGNLLEGKWVATYDDTEITNTWTPATPVYSGEAEFTIVKVDQDGEPLDGVVFEINGEEYTTKDGGKITISIADAETAEDDLTFEIEETKTLDNYELVEGTEELNVTSTSEFDHVDLDAMQNIYIKTYIFEASENDGYAWDGDAYEYTVHNQGLGKTITIKKTFKGVSARVLGNLTFTVTGPAGFEEQTVPFSEFDVSGTTATYELEGYLPVGQYTVTESNAEVENFNLTVSGDDGKSKTVELGGEVEFTINNIYEVIKDVEYRVKKVWDDADNQDGKRPGVLEITLLQNDEEYDVIQLTEDGGWEHAWTALPRVDEDNIEYVYTSKEATVDEYESDGGEEIDGVFTFTNSYTPETIIIKVNKSWIDDNNSDKLRNDDTTITFCVKGTAEEAGYTSTPVCQTVLTGIGQKTDVVVFEDLPKYYFGEELKYSVEEVDVLAGYTTDLVPTEYITIIDGEGSVDVTNTHEIEGGRGGGGAPDTGSFTRELSFAVSNNLFGYVSIIFVASGALIFTRFTKKTGRK